MVLHRGSSIGWKDETNARSTAGHSTERERNLAEKHANDTEDNPPGQYYNRSALMDLPIAIAIHSLGVVALVPSAIAEIGGDHAMLFTSLAAE